MGRPLAVTVRRFVESDVPSVVDLFERVYPEYRWSSPAGLSAYFRQVFFEGPWRHLDLPSWIAAESGGACGFAGIVPRAMTFDGRSIKVGVGAQLMVAPDRRHSLVALQLVKRTLTGPQDLFVTDGANDSAMRLWAGVGGAVPALQNLHWTRPLRPFRYGLDLLARSGPLRALTRLARAPGRLADALAARAHPNRFHQLEPSLIDVPLDVATMLAALNDVGGRKCLLRPCYDADSLGWQLEQVALKQRHGRLRARAVFDHRTLLGWFLYYAQPGTVNEVLQIGAIGASFDRVLRQLMVDAWRQGATALRGRVDPLYVEQLSERHCWFRREGSWTLAHSRHADIVAAIERGAAGFSRLEGEWWLRFHGG